MLLLVSAQLYAICRVDFLRCDMAFDFSSQVLHDLKSFVMCASWGVLVSDKTLYAGCAQ